MPRLTKGLYSVKEQLEGKLTKINNNHLGADITIDKTTILIPFDIEDPDLSHARISRLRTYKDKDVFQEYLEQTKLKLEMPLAKYLIYDFYKNNLDKISVRKIRKEEILTLMYRIKLPNCRNKTLTI